MGSCMEMALLFLDGVILIGQAMWILDDPLQVTSSLLDPALFLGAVRSSLLWLSSTEAEYRALCSTAMEAVWLRRMLTEIGFSQTGPTELRVDNQSALALAKNPVFHARTKHMFNTILFVSGSWILSFQWFTVPRQTMRLIFSPNLCLKPLCFTTCRPWVFRPSQDLRGGVNLSIIIVSSSSPSEGCFVGVPAQELGNSVIYILFLFWEKKGGEGDCCPSLSVLEKRRGGGGLLSQSGLSRPAGLADQPPTAPIKEGLPSSFNNKAYDH